MYIEIRTYRLKNGGIPAYLAAVADGIAIQRRHLGTLVGTRAIGWYFSRARVHETGPYGEGHWVYQHAAHEQPQRWPIRESLALMCGDQYRSAADWMLWKSRMDRWGAFFDDGYDNEAVEHSRVEIWRACAPNLCESMAA